MRRMDLLSDSRNIVTGIAGLFAVAITVQYYVSDYGDELPKFLSYSIASLIGAGVLIYWLFLVQASKTVTKKVRVDKDEVAKIK